MAPSCCSPKASTISGMPRLPVLRNMAGRISGPLSLSPEFEQESSKPGSRITRAPAPHKRQVRRGSRVFHRGQKTSAGVKRLDIGPVDATGPAPAAAHRGAKAHHRKHRE